ncbi:hypothetical protein, partial [Staphylococcus aureus]
INYLMLNDAYDNQVRISSVGYGPVFSLLLYFAAALLVHSPLQFCILRSSIKSPAYSLPRNN